MSNSQPYPGTQTVRRAVTLLKAFSDERPEWGLSDLARAVGLNKTTTYRLLMALENEGMITRNASSEAYQLGPAAITLGGRALRSSGLRTTAHAELVALAQITRETATLEVLAEGQVLILDEVFGSHLLGNIQSLGTRWPAHATSTGKVLLAGLPAAQRDALLVADLTGYTRNTITSAGALRAELDKVQRAGYATAVEELEVGFTAVSAPIRDVNRATVGALSVGGPSLRFTAERLPAIVAQVRAAAERVSRRLGA